MSQRDCGCPGLVTPTLDDLLAVARNKPLPRMKVRERRPPPAKIGATLKGWMEWRLVDRRGREVAGGEGPNLILDQGLDAIATTALKHQQDTGGTPATFFPIIQYAAVGTDNTSPATSQTGLGAEIGRTGVTYATDTLARPGDGIYQLTRFIEFDYDQANGNLTEWGFSSTSSAGANLFNRALFLDGEGSPEVVTKTTDYKLRIAYTLQVSLSPVTWTAGSFTIDGVGTVNGDYMLLGASAPGSAETRCGAPDLIAFSALARGDVNTILTNNRILTGSAAALAADQSGLSYASELTFNATVANSSAADAYEDRDAYTPGSFTRTGGSWRWDTGRANHDPVVAFAIMGASEGFGVTSCNRAGYAFAVDVGDRFSKDDEHRLIVGMPVVTWGRA